MNLEDFGYNEHLEKCKAVNNPEGYEIGRIIAEHRERYIVATEKGDLEAEITGNLRFSAKNREDFPAVGDWVALTSYDSGFAIIHRILPRYSVISRQATGKFGEIQIIAANIDFALIVQAIDRDFSINRLERYLTISHSSGVSPIIVITKTDLLSGQEVDNMIREIRQRITDIPVIPLSNETRDGYEALKAILQNGKTFCLLGSSGVGKSTLLNNLSGKNIMNTGTISQSTDRGRHITTHRELIVLEDGAIFIDNPGMREVGIADRSGGLETTFDLIADLSKKCRFKNCTHTDESGCSVLEALESGEIDRDSFDNFQKLVKERSHFESTVAERRQKDKKFGKMLKEYHKLNVNRK